MFFLATWFVSVAQPSKEIIWNELTKDKSIVLEQDAEGSYVLNNFPFKTKFKNKTNAVNTFSYEEDGKVISFTPYGVKLRDAKNTFIPAPKVRGTKLGNKNNTDSIMYVGGMGTGISIINEVTKVGYRKIIKIDNDKVFGALNGKVDSVELIFEIKNLTFDSLNWDKKSTKIFNTEQRLSELSYLQPVSIWDGDTAIIVPAKLYTEDGKMFIAKVIPVSFFKADRPVYTDITVTFGSIYTVYNSSSNYFSLVKKVSDNSVIIAYKDAGSGSFLRTKIGTISGTVLSFGNETGIAIMSNYVDLEELSTNKFLIAYQRDDNTGGVIVLNISGTTITTGTELIFEGTTIQPSLPDLLRLSDTRMILLYTKSTTTQDRRIKVLDISGNTITAGSAYAWASGDIYASWTNDALGYISSTQFIVVYRTYTGGAYKGRAFIGTVSGTSISYGTTYEWVNTGAGQPNIVMLNSTKGVILGRNSTDRYLNAVVANISGTTITFGSVYSNSINSAYQYGIKLSESSVLIAYSDLTNSYMRTVSMTVSGDALQYGDVSTVTSGTAGATTGLCLVSPTSIVTTYSTTAAIKAIVGTLPVSGKKINGITYTKWNNSTITKWNNQ